MTTNSKATGIEAAVCADIAERQSRGIAKYGVTVADNPLDLRAWLQHAYEEHLDAAVYLRRAIAEIDAAIPEKCEQCNGACREWDGGNCQYCGGFGTRAPRKGGTP